MTQKKFKYGHVIYRWKHILMLISDFKEFFQRFHFWAQGRGSKWAETGDPKKVFQIWSSYIPLEAYFDADFIFSRIFSKNNFWPVGGAQSGGRKRVTEISFSNMVMLYIFGSVF